jgi:hypothetical protein
MSPIQPVMDTAKTMAPTRLINSELTKPQSKNEMPSAVTAGQTVGFGKCGGAGLSCVVVSSIN